MPNTASSYFLNMEFDTVLNRTFMNTLTTAAGASDRGSHRPEIPVHSIAGELTIQQASRREAPSRVEAVMAKQLSRKTDVHRKRVI